MGGGRRAPDGVRAAAVGNGEPPRPPPGELRARDAASHLY